MNKTKLASAHQLRNAGFEVPTNTQHHIMNKTKQTENETVLIAGAQSHRMLTEAKLPQSGIDRFCVLANDIESMANDEFDGDAVAAARELQTRIGGLQNLKSYTDCLLVGNRKFGL